MPPQATILMPVFNGEQHLREAINSILKQTFEDFEFLIINDGSTDSSRDIVTSFKDPRIRLVDNPKNMGLTKSLNKGLDLAGGEYIVRMDDDDIASPDRLARQIGFMEGHEDVDVCGGWMRVFGENIDEIWKVPEEWEEIKVHLLFYNVIYHPAAIIRTRIIKDHNIRYDESFKYAQDYALWTNLMHKHRLSNLQEVLVRHRVHDRAVGLAFLEEQTKCADRVRLQQLNRLGISPSSEMTQLHLGVCKNQYGASRSFIRNMGQWFGKIYKANLERNLFSKEILLKTLTEKWLGVYNTYNDTKGGRLVTIFSCPILDFTTRLTLAQKMLRSE